MSFIIKKSQIIRTKEIYLFIYIFLPSCLLLFLLFTRHLLLSSPFYPSSKLYRAAKLTMERNLHSCWQWDTVKILWYQIIVY